MDLYKIVEQVSKRFKWSKIHFVWFVQTTNTDVLVLFGMLNQPCNPNLDFMLNYQIVQHLDLKVSKIKLRMMRQAYFKLIWFSRVPIRHYRYRGLGTRILYLSSHILYMCSWIVRSMSGACSSFVVTLWCIYHECFRV